MIASDALPTRLYSLFKSDTLDDTLVMVFFTVSMVSFSVLSIALSTELTTLPVTSYLPKYESEYVKLGNRMKWN